MANAESGTGSPLSPDSSPPSGGFPTTRDGLMRRIADTDMSGPPEAIRTAFASLFPPAPPLPRRTIGGVPCGVAGPEGAPPALWLHGGGLVLGSPDTHAAAVRHVARVAACRIVVPDYPLAPERPWPAQRDACLAVLDALPGAVPVIGDSVGGQLALILAMRRPGRVSGLALISPNTDRTGRSTTRERTSDLMNDDAGDRGFARMAFGDADPRDVEVSPLLGDLSVLPPTLILTAGAEILQDDGLLLARAASLAGADVTLRTWPGLWHLWPLWPDILPEARAALDAVADRVAR